MKYDDLTLIKFVDNELEDSLSDYILISSVRHYVFLGSRRSLKRVI